MGGKILVLLRTSAMLDGADKVAPEKLESLPAFRASIKMRECVAAVGDT